MRRPNPDLSSMMRAFGLYVLLCTAAHAADQWQPSLATISSLRTGGASLVSSDAATLEDGGLALITYWEVRTDRDLDVYRCIDTVDANLASTGQQCWSALRPTGGGPIVIQNARSSNDICRIPDNFGGMSSLGFCAISEAIVVKTPYFELTVMPFENGSMVSLSDGGRYLLVSNEMPGGAFLDVRATSLDEHEVFADRGSVEELLALEPDGLACELETTTAREWATCVASDAPERAVRYTVHDGFVYEISHTSNVPDPGMQYLSAMASSFRVLSEARR